MCSSHCQIFYIVKYSMIYFYNSEWTQTKFYIYSKEAKQEITKSYIYIQWQICTTIFSKPYIHTITNLHHYRLLNIVWHTSIIQNEHQQNFIYTPKKQNREPQNFIYTYSDKFAPLYFPNHIYIQWQIYTTRDC